MHDELVLDSDQRRAVQTQAAAVIVVAGAGAGKTEVVARRVEHILLQSPNDSFRVLALSYTVKAADELADRFRTRLGNLHRRVDADTIHGFALSLLRQFGSRIGLAQELEILTRDVDRFELLDEWLLTSGYDRPTESPSELFADLDLARAQEREAPYLAEWNAALESAGALDFPALLDKAVDLVELTSVRRHLQGLYRHVIVDEAQNLTPVQYTFISHLVGEPSDPRINVILVGDDRQSIVDFAGADAKLIARFEREYRAERIELRNNYRSAQKIIRVGELISRALGRPAQSADAYAARGSVALQIFENEEAEGRGIASWVQTLLSWGLDKASMAPGERLRVYPEEVAILARSSGALRFVQSELEKLGIATAVASTEDDWVVTLAGRMIVEVAAYNASPEARSVRRRMESLLGLETGEWETAKRSLEITGHTELLPLFQARDPIELIRAAEKLPIEEDDWENDLHQLKTALESFLDRTDKANRTLGSFRHHIARCQRGGSLDPGVRLLTIHKAQGREFRAVAVIACNEGQLPDFRATSDEERASELRAFYVAVTRPTRVLLLTRALRRNTRYGPRPTNPSSFLKYIEPVLQE